MEKESKELNKSKSSSNDLVKISAFEKLMRPMVYLNVAKYTGKPWLNIPGFVYIGVKQK